MNIILSFSYIAINILISNSIISPFSLKGEGKYSIIAMLSWFVIFSVTFFSGFYLLGYINLATHFPTVNTFYATIVGLIVLVGIGLWTTQRRAGSGEDVAPPDPVWSLPFRFSIPPASRYSRLLCILTLLTFVTVALMLMAGFPRGYEPTAYHLPIALHTFQTQSLKIWDPAYMHTFPANGSIYYGFLLGFLSEHLVAAAGFAFLALLGITIYGLSQATGADTSASLLATMGMVTIPMVAFSTFEAGADVAGMAFLALALYFIIARPQPRSRHVILSGLAAGLAYGFKSLHLVSMAFLFLLILVQSWRSSQRRTVWSRGIESAAPGLMFLLAAVAMCGFWLVRNYVELGNPIYPMSFPVFDLIGWSKASDFDFAQRAANQFEWVRSSAEWFIYPWVEWHYANENFKHSSGLGAFFAATVPIAGVVGGVDLIQRKRSGETYFVLAACLLGGCFILAVWWLLNDRQPRYLMGALVFLVPLAGYMISKAQGRGRLIFELIVIGCILSMLGVIFSKQLVEFGTRFVLHRQFARHHFYSYPEGIDHLPANSTILHIGERPWHYALYGNKHDARVVSYREAIRVFGQKQDDRIRFHLRSAHLKKLGVTHLFTVDSPILTLEDCLRLQEVARKDPERGQFSQRQSELLRLYQIQYSGCRAS
jgi:hypothetical protein